MKKLNCLGVIPARFPSTRLPGKPLKDICGKTLIQRVYEQVGKSKHVAEYLVATDDERIAEHVRSFGGKAMMTSSEHHTGSDRVAEVMESYRKQGREFDFIANIQGDMPFINPAVIDMTIEALAVSGPSLGMSTVATPMMSEEEFLRPQAVKVVLGYENAALYFSRAPIPFWREPKEIKVSDQEPCGYKHMGLYIFRPEALLKLTKLPQSLPEKREKLEQLRALTGGIGIKVAIASLAMVHPSIEVDTEEDLARARAACSTLPK